MAIQFDQAETRNCIMFTSWTELYKFIKSVSQDDGGVAVMV